MWSGPLSVPRLKPLDVLDVGVSPEDWQDRFPSTALCEPLAKDAKHEERALRKYIEQNRLEQWVLQVQEAAQQLQENQVKEKAAHKKSMEELRGANARKQGQEKENSHYQTNGVKHDTDDV